MRAFFFQLHQSGAGLDGGCLEKGPAGRAVLGGVHAGHHLVELGGEAFEGGEAALLELLVVFGGEDDELAAVVAGDGEGLARGEASDLAEFVFENAGRDFGQSGDGGETGGVRSGSGGGGVGHGRNVLTLAKMARLAIWREYALE